MVTSKSLSVQTQQPYQAGDVLEQLAVIPDGRTAKKVQDVSDTLSSYQVVVNEDMGIVEETKTPAGQEVQQLLGSHCRPSDKSTWKKRPQNSSRKFSQRPNKHLKC